MSELTRRQAMAIDKVFDAVTDHVNEAVIRGYLRAALRNIDEVMGEGCALRYPDLVMPGKDRGSGARGNPAA